MRASRPDVRGRTGQSCFGKRIARLRSSPREPVADGPDVPSCDAVEAAGEFDSGACSFLRRRSSCSLMFRAYVSGMTHLLVTA